MIRPAVFGNPYRNLDLIHREIGAWLLAHPGHFGTPEGAMRHHFHNIMVPPSLRWALKINDKTATTSVLRILYELEWGVPFTVEMEAPDDINPESVIHRQLHADVMRRIYQVQGGLEALDCALRVTTVRHPSVRAVSAFLYICTTQERRATWMVDDRIRMGALVGFDWGQHMRTPEGFLRFLEYATIWGDTKGIVEVNSHWRPQWALIRPEIFRPDLVGRCEDLTPFVEILAARLLRPTPALPQSNTQARYDPSPFLTYPGVRERLANLYAADYDTFGYDLDEVPQ